MCTILLCSELRSALFPQTSVEYELRANSLTRNVMSGPLMYHTVRSKAVGFSIALMLFAATTGVSIGAPKKRTEPINVGMIALLASPQTYNGKILETVGFLNIGSMRENDNLWLHEEDGRFSLYKNSFGLDLSDDQRKKFLPLNHSYVIITGTLHSDGPEGSKMNSGIIVNVTQMDGWSPYHPLSPATTK